MKSSTPQLYPDMSANSRTGPESLTVSPSFHWSSRRGTSSTGTPSFASQELGQPPAKLVADRSSSATGSVECRPLVYMASPRRELVVCRSAVPTGSLRRELALSMVPPPRAPPDSLPRPLSASRVNVSCCLANILLSVKQRRHISELLLKLLELDAVFFCSGASGGNRIWSTRSRHLDSTGSSQLRIYEFTLVCSLSSGVGVL